MKTIISGRLITDPEIRDVQLKDGSNTKVCNYRLWVSDPAAPAVEGENGKEYKRDVPFSCTAWGDNAEKIAAKKAGDTITGSYTMRYSERKIGDKSYAMPEYVVRKIDPENNIQKEMSDLLTEYEKSDREHLRTEIAQPSLNKDVAIEKAPEKDVEKSVEVEK